MKNPYAPMVEKKKWEQLNKKVGKADVQARVEIAAACGLSSDDEPLNLLYRMLKDPDESVQIQAVKSLGECGSEQSKTHISWLAGHLPPEGHEEMRQAIQECSASMAKRIKRQ